MRRLFNAWLLGCKTVTTQNGSALFFLCAAAAFVAGCGETVTLGAFEPRSCWEGVRPIEGYQRTCGYVGVRRESGPSALTGDEVLGLAVVTYRPPNTVLPPLVYLPGGPGGNAVTVAGAPEALAALAGGKREIVLFDPRGVGWSLPDLGCETAVGDFGDDAKVDRWIRACRRDSRGYNSVENAADVASVAAALGHEQVAIFGSSYGTRLAQHVVRDHPSLVSSMILEGVMPMEAEVDILGSWGVAIEEAVAAANAECQAVDVCRALAPDLEEIVKDVLARLPTEGIDLGGERLTPVAFIQQIRVAASHFGLEELVKIVLAAQMLIDGPTDSVRLLSGDVEDLLWFRIRSTVYQGHPVWAAVSASERIRGTQQMPPAQWAASQEATTELVAGIERVGESWNVGTLPEDAMQTVRSDVPALLLNGGIDASTPASWAHLVGGSLTRSTVAVIPTAGHGVSVAGDPCGVELVAAFLAAPQATLDTTCAERRRFDLALLSGWNF